MKHRGPDLQRVPRRETESGQSTELEREEKKVRSRTDRESIRGNTEPEEAVSGKGGKGERGWEGRGQGDGKENKEITQP